MKIFERLRKKFTKDYDKGLEKTRNEIQLKLNTLALKHRHVTEEYFEELEEILIAADIGVKTVVLFVERLKKRVKKENIIDSKDLLEIIIDELFIIYVNGDIVTSKINFVKEEPTIILVVGVNGVGKTTTIGKLANKFRQDNKKVLLIPADTFRAGASEQLEAWANKVKVDFFNSKAKDPASVVYDGINFAKQENYDVVLIDTAGRLQNKVDLMKELEKINKVIKNFIPAAPHETLLIIDATTGQNGISQVKSFKEITNVTGLVLTKLDGTAKGGIVLAIKEETNVPVKFIGVGEAMEDLQSFDLENYIYGLFKEYIEEKNG